jgi:hypothetical protein
MKRPLVRRQKNLIDLNLIGLICNILRCEEDMTIKLEAIRLGISLLEGGNRDGQNDFYKKLSADQDNLILTKIQDIIDQNFYIIKKKMSELNDREIKNKFANGIIIENKDTEQKLQFQLDLVTKVFRFLQLLCEGHNETLQKYLNTQKEEDQLTTRNINFIKYSSNVLGSFVKFINSYCTELGEQVIDF